MTQSRSIRMRALLSRYSRGPNTKAWAALLLLCTEIYSEPVFNLHPEPGTSWLWR